MRYAASFRTFLIVSCLVTFAWPAASCAQRRIPVKRSWGPEQATGEPDTPGSGDIVTAWASASPDGQKEWLVCKYETAQRVSEIIVHETFNPGALYKVTAFDADDEEHVAWEGDDPTGRDQPRGISAVPVKLAFKTRKIKLYIDSPGVPGWNEIDAVGIRNAGETQWASEVEASSTFAGANERLQLRIPPDQDRVQHLEALLLKINARHKQEMQRLRDEIRELRRLLEERAN